MEKALAAFILSLFETATWIWGDNTWWSHDVEQKVAWAVTLLTPFIVWLVPSRVGQKK